MSGSRWLGVSSLGPWPESRCLCGRAGGTDSDQGDEMNHRRLVGIDLGIASAHTVRVIDGEGKTVAKRKPWPPVETLTEAEEPPLPGCPPGTPPDGAVEPTGPA